MANIWEENSHTLAASLNIPEAINKHQVEEVIIAIESSEHENIGRIINEVGRH
jgi:hypothetical protein